MQTYLANKVSNQQKDTQLETDGGSTRNTWSIFASKTNKIEPAKFMDYGNKPAKRTNTEDLAIRSRSLTLFLQHCCWAQGAQGGLGPNQMESKPINI